MPLWSTEVETFGHLVTDGVGIQVHFIVDPVYPQMHPVVTFYLLNV